LLFYFVKPPQPMQIVVNGQPRDLPQGTTLAQLLAELGLQARHVAVEVNLEVVPRRQHADHHLAEGDRLEVVTLVGGG
jgi:sulfur carrier protein